MSTKARQIDSLTPLRGIAALLVVVYHIDSILWMMQLGPLTRGTGFFARGYLWVDFFFVLSGFIITHVYGSRFTERVTREQARDYIVARFSRLYPLYFFTLCLSVLLYVGMFSRMPSPAGENNGGMSMEMLYDWKALPFHFLLLLGFGLTGMTWNVPAWSIATEWWTYLLALPVFRHLNRGVSARAFLLPLACVLGLYALIINYTSPMFDIKPLTLNITFDFGLLRCVLDFIIGICLYQFYRAGTGARLLASDGALLAAALLTAAVLHFPVPSGLPPAPGSFPPVPPLTPILDALSPLVFAGLILCAAFNATAGHRFLNARPLQRLGEISYSLYLMQGMAFTVFFIGSGIWRRQHPTGRMDTLPMLGLLFGTLLADILMAMATYRWIEVPAREALRRRLARKPALATEAAVTEREGVPASATAGAGDGGA